MKLFAVGMRVVSTGFGAHIINGAVVVGAQKRAGRLVEHIIPVFVYMQVLLHQRRRPYAEVAGNAFYVFIPKNRAGGFATIGASKAISLFKNRLVQCFHHLVQLPGRFSAQSFEVRAGVFSVALGLLLPCL